MYSSHRFECCCPIDIPSIKLHDFDEDLEECTYTVNTQVVADS